jgi:formamidopyrimidine-DNA glycosylase
MGPDALELNERDFKRICRQSYTKNIKSLMMDQEVMGGIGNEYSNEILYQTGLDPHKKYKDLSEKEQETLHRTLKKVLQKAIEIRVPEGKFPQSWLLSHEKDMKCPKDPSHTLKQETIVGRSAKFCPEHQK